MNNNEALNTAIADRQSTEAKHATGILRDAIIVDEDEAFDSPHQELCIGIIRALHSELIRRGVSSEQIEVEVAYYIQTHKAS